MSHWVFLSSNRLSPNTTVLDKKKIILKLKHCGAINIMAQKYSF